MRRSLLDKMLLQEVMSYFFFGVALFTTILVAMIELKDLTSAVVEHGVPLGTAIQLFGLSLPRFMAMAFPMSMLLSTLLAFGKLSSDSEITALVAAGVSYVRMAIPIALVGIVVALVAIGFNEVVAPAATQAKNHLYEIAIANRMPGNRAFHYAQVVNGRILFTLDADNYDDQDKKLLRPKIVYYGDDGTPAGIEWAQSGRWQGGTSWDLYNGHGVRITDNPRSPIPNGDFEQQHTSIGVSLEQLLAASQDPDEMTYAQLRARIARERRNNPGGSEVNADLVSLHAKVSIPFASLVFAFIGFPLGIRRQRSGSQAAGLGLSIGIIFVYYLVYQYATILGNSGAVPPLLSAWMPNILFLIVGLALVRRASA